MDTTSLNFCNFFYKMVLFIICGWLFGHKNYNSFFYGATILHGLKKVGNKSIVIIPWKKKRVPFKVCFCLTIEKRGWLVFAKTL